MSERKEQVMNKIVESSHILAMYRLIGLSIPINIENYAKWVQYDNRLYNMIIAARNVSMTDDEFGTFYDKGAQISPKIEFSEN